MCKVHSRFTLSVSGISPYGYLAGHYGFLGRSVADRFSLRQPLEEGYPPSLRRSTYRTRGTGMEVDARYLARDRACRRVMLSPRHRLSEGFRYGPRSKLSSLRTTIGARPTTASGGTIRCPHPRPPQQAAFGGARRPRTGGPGWLRSEVRRSSAAECAFSDGSVLVKHGSSHKFIVEHGDGTRAVA